MNKTLSINLNSLVFQIDEIAYEKLSAYLKAISNRFKNTEGGQEIISDIEGRIAEMFSEKLSNIKQVVSLADVETVITVMGKPEEFDKIEEEFEEITEEAKSKHTPRKLFRDPDNSVMGGVCSGISAYLGISDPIFLRLLFLIAFFGFGTGFLVYIILWIVIPEAKTASDKLNMRGEPINISNIEKTITDEFESIKSNFSKGGNSKKSSMLGNLLKRIMQLIIGIATALLKVFGVFLIIAGSIVLMTFFTGTLTAVISSDVSLMTLSNYFFSNSTHQISAFIIAGILLFVPIFLLIYLGLIFVGGKRFSIPGFSRSMLVLFFISIIGLSVISIYTANLFSKSSTGSKKVELSKATNGTYYIQGDFSSSQYKNEVEILELGEFAFENNQLLLGDRVQLDILRSMDSNAYLETITRAKGQSREEAFNAQNSIDYTVVQNDSALNFPYYIPINEGQKIRGQKIQMHLYLPLGARAFLSYNADNIIYDIKNVTNTYDGDMLGHTWEMQPAGLTCIDCGGISQEQTPSKKKSKMKDIAIQGDFDKIEVNGQFDLQIEKGAFALQSNAEEEFIFNISNNKLNIKNKDGQGFLSNKTSLKIQLPSLKALELNSASAVKVSGFDDANMDFEISGANTCQFDIRPKNLSLEINGAAKVGLIGSAENFELEINGASVLDGLEFRANNADVSIAGTSKVKLWVEKNLDADVSGASKLSYKGLPKIISEVSGFSSISPIH